MPVGAFRPVLAEDLTETIERNIVQRTWGRIHQLSVQLCDDRILVRGRTPSYYVKQLAIQGALEALDDDAPHLDINIDVEADLPHRVP